MTDEVKIYRAGAHDVGDLARLAALDSQPPPTEPMLVAAVHGQLRAAIRLGGGPAIADPFHPTAQLVALLELRAVQLGETAGRARRPRYAFLLPQRHRAATQVAS